MPTPLAIDHHHVDARSFGHGAMLAMALVSNQHIGCALTSKAGARRGMMET